MKKAFVLLSMYVVFFSACVSKKEEQDNDLATYFIASPIIVDTVLINQYVADIHSLQNVEIRARVKGYIEKIYVDEGKPVKTGQLLFSISNKRYQQELLKTQAILKKALANCKSVELEVKNVQTLLDKNIVSKTELEIAKSNLEIAKAKIEEAKSDEANATLNLSLTDVKAPFDGVINRIPNKTGSLIDDGTLLTTLSNNTEVLAYFNVSETEYLDIISKQNTNRNKEVELILVNDQRYPYRGRIETVEGEFDKNTGNIAFRARFSNPEHLLKHGSSGKILLQKEIKHAMIIPQKSTFEIQENIYVFIVDSLHEVHMRRIVPKLRLHNLFIIESGLKPNDKILYEGIQLVKEGEKIIPKTISTTEVFKNTNH